ncbi:MAG: histone deacetylase [Myxococcales bacterium]|nr:histone deacetylase [Myxococcales bacterium]
MSGEPESPVAVVDDERFDEHHERSGRHPERPERLAAARAGLYGTLDRARCQQVEARDARPAELEAVHGADYLAQLRNALDGSFGHLDADTFYSPGSQEATWLAAGASAELSQRLMAGEAKRGVALLRPPGHHAEPGHAMGFCMLNNVAIAAQAALAAGAERVAVVDWDVHHGNGTQHAFYADPRVLFISLHQYPFYPGTGAADETGRGAGEGYTANVALPAGQGVETYAHAFRTIVLPLLDQLGPDLLLVSAGFDAHAYDPLANMELDADSYRAMASSLLDHVDRAGHGRIAFMLEGGYDLGALQQSVAGVASALKGERLELPDDACGPAGQQAVERTRRALAGKWQLGDGA